MALRGAALLLVLAVFCAVVLVPAPAQAAGTWERKADMPMARGYFGVAALNGKIYVAGGLIEGGTDTVTDVVEVYDPATDTWSTAAPMPLPLWGHVLVAIQGKLVAAGGATAAVAPAAPTNFTHVYDPVQDRWTAGRPMPEGRIWAAGVAVGASVEVWGGTTPFPGVPSSSRFAYAVGPDRWTVLQPMPMSLTNFGVAATPTFVYATGGWRNLPNTSAFRLLTDTWSEKSPMLKGRGSHACAELGGLVYAIAGVTADTTEDAPSRTVEAYAPGNDTWRRVADYPESAHALGAVTVGATLYAMGGTVGTASLGSLYALAEAAPPQPPAPELPWALMAIAVAVVVGLVLMVVAMVWRSRRKSLPPSR